MTASKKITKDKDEQLLPVMREVKVNKYHTNIRHGAVVGGHPFLGYKNGCLTYISISGIYSSREMSEDVFKSFVEYNENKQKYLPCHIDTHQNKKSTDKSRIIQENNFIPMRIREDRFLFILSYVRGRSDSFDDFLDKFPVKRRIETTRTVYLTPNLIDEIERKLKIINKSEE